MHAHNFSNKLQDAAGKAGNRNLKKLMLIYGTASWSLLYGLAGLFWAFGGRGFPYGDEDAANMGSLFTGVQPDSGGSVIAVLGFAGAVAALIMSGTLRTGKGAKVLSVFAWMACLTLVLIVPDVRLLRDLAYSLIGVFQTLDASSLNQFYCLGGGILWGASALTFRASGQKAKYTAITNSSSAARWGTWAVYLAMVCALPWAIIRLSWFAGYPLGVSPGVWNELNSSLNGSDPGAVKYLFASLPILGSLLTLGLVRSWGEVFPRWIPLVGGKSVPPLAAIVPGGLVAVILIVAGTRMYGFFIPEVLNGNFDAANWGVSLPIVFFLPWGLFLGLAVLSYYYRR